MAILNRNDITNLYLYGQLTTPVNLLDSSLIRPKDTVIRVDVDAVELMKGPGRFAVGSQFELIKRFFNSNISISPGTYTKSEINARILKADRIYWTMKQYNYVDSVDDYLDRVWVYNSMAFKISDDAKFIVEQNGERRIENFATEPFINEDPNKRDNFDFGSEDITTSILNAFAGPKIDPSGIGRKVFLDYVNADLIPRTTYTQEAFEKDFQKSNSLFNSGYVDTPVAIGILIGLSGGFIDGLFNDGVIKFLDGNKPIIYGTVDADVISVEKSPIDGEGIIGGIQSKNYPTLYKFKGNGVVLLGGKGADTLIGGTRTSDILMGNEGNDQLTGQLSHFSRGNDTLNGGAGNDTLDGGLGDRDIAVFSDKFENYKYTISDRGLFGLGGKIITFAHNKGTQADGTDTLQDIEFAQFSDRIVPLPLKDGPKDTKQSDIYDNNGQLFASVSLTLPTFMLDEDADYTLNLSSVQGT
ncbi:hypothetical protein IQ229_06920 [Nostoc cf. edaphicum LEGE 07299]|uniref:Hemolysin-type calcium-binding region n=1 Tax=Nostoc cf. edaphicum LEGE 07299 TaxID=2777974 RepID=A0ABR9TX48_9NOSO|nr:hypothetical protein [Nostoc edaphicum]MBE9104682.1 hypothetical protein [Nostoc cf. edaphicum LEGE 07299]